MVDIVQLLTQPVSKREQEVRKCDISDSYARGEYDDYGLLKTV
jgi:hypothetical protein